MGRAQPTGSSPAGGLPIPWCREGGVIRVLLGVPRPLLRVQATRNQPAGGGRRRTRPSTTTSDMMRTTKSFTERSCRLGEAKSYRRLWSPGPSTTSCLNICSTAGQALCLWDLVRRWLGSAVVLALCGCQGVRQCQYARAARDAGLESISEQRPSSTNGLPPGMLQALNQLGEPSLEVLAHSF